MAAMRRWLLNLIAPPTQSTLLTYVIAGGAGTWPWWRWSNRTEPLEQSAEVLGQFDDIWTDTYYHRAHGLYLQRIMHRASMRVKDGEKDVYVYFRAYNYGHVIHCNKLLNELDVPLTERPATVSRVIGHCVKMS
jgi:hypothetical protein